MFEALGRLTARPRLVLGVTLLIVIGLVVAGRGVAKDLVSGGTEDPGSQSYQAEQFLSAHFPTGQPNLVLLVKAPSGLTVTSPAVVSEGKSLTRRLSSEANVVGVQSFWLTQAPTMRSTDGRYALIDAHITGSDTQSNQTYDTIESGFGGKQGDVTVSFGASSAVDHAIRSQIQTDLARAELIALPITLIILILVFGSLIAALVPLLVGIIAIVGTDAALRVISSFTSVSVFSQNLTTALGLGLAIDYSLLLVRRFREEQRAGKDVHDAVRTAVHSAGRTIVFSALTVAVSLSSMLVFPMFILRSFAYAGISVVLFAAVTAVTVVPAALVALGNRVNSLDVRRLFGYGRRQRAGRPDNTGRGWRWLTGTVMRGAPIFAILVTGGLVVLLLPFTHVSFGLADYRQLPSSSQPRQVQQTLQDKFANGNPTASITVLTSHASPAELTDFAERVSYLANVDTVAGPTGIFRLGAPLPPPPGAAAGAPHPPGAPPPVHRPPAPAYGTWRYLTVSPTSSATSTQSQDLVNAIRAMHPGFTVKVSGTAADLVDTKHAISSKLPLAAGIIAIATLLLIFLFTGSILVPLLSVLLSALSLTAMFGMVVWIFQYGHGASTLGFTSTGFIDVTIPVLMFCVAFGLSMDYSVFLISRIKEKFDQTRDNRAAVIFGVERTGGIITAAALILAVVLLAVGSSRITNIKMLGLGVALAVLVDSFVVRCLLVPSVMGILGNATWWAPRPLQRFQARFGLKEEVLAPAPAAETIDAETPAPEPVSVADGAPMASVPESSLDGNKS